VPGTSLEPLITECPSCRTRFRVSETQLSAAGGRVRCGACLSVFQGTDYLIFGTATSQQTEAPGPELDELLDELNEATRVEPARGARNDDARVARKSDAPARGVSAGEPKGVIERAGEAARPLGRRDARPVPFRKPARAAEPTAPVRVVELQEATGADAAAPGREPPSIEKRDAPLAPTAAQNTPDAAPEVAEADAADIEEIELTAASIEIDAATAEALAEAMTSAPAAEAVEPAASSAAAAAPQEAEPPAAPAPAADAAKPAEAEKRTAPALTLEPVAEPRAAAVVQRALPALQLEPDAEAPRRRRWWQPIVLVVLVVALAGQVLWLQFATWSVDPQIRPIYAFGCRYLGCTLPVMRDLSAIHVRNLAVRSNPDTGDALLVDALIINEAQFAQPFPLLEMRFFTIDGKVVAGRRFTPSEYLSGELAGAKTMQPRTPIHIALEIEDPGRSAVNYQMGFL